MVRLWISEMNRKVRAKLDKLYAMPSSYQFTKEELKNVGKKSTFDVDKHFFNKF